MGFFLISAVTMCDDTLCMNRGTCCITGASYVCHCIQVYTGKNCEITVGAFHMNETVGYISSRQATYSFHPFTDEHSLKEMSEANSYCISFGTDGLARAQLAEELDIIKDGYKQFVSMVDLNQYYMAGHTDVPLHHVISMPDVNISNSGRFCVILSNWENKTALYSKECYLSIWALGAVCAYKH